MQNSVINQHSIFIVQQNTGRMDVLITIQHLKLKNVVKNILMVVLVLHLQKNERLFGKMVDKKLKYQNQI